MKDICIKFNCTTLWGYRRYPDLSKIDTYKTWIRKNLKKDSYHFPRSHRDIVFFRDPEDLTLFTLIHGRVYDCIGEGYIDTNKIDRMLLQESALERMHVKDNN